MIAVTGLLCASCASPAPGSLAEYVRGSWDCAIEEAVADGDLYPAFEVRDAEIQMTLTSVGEDMSGSGRTPTPVVGEPVTLAYRIVGDTIEVETGSGAFTIEAAEVIPEAGSIPVRINGQQGYTAEIGPGTLRLTVAAPADSDEDVYEYVRCERIVDY